MASGYSRRDLYAPVSVDDSWHTRGFYERAGVLYHYARGTPLKKLVLGADDWRAVAHRLAKDESGFVS